MAVVETSIGSNFLGIIKLGNLNTPLHFGGDHFDDRRSWIQEVVSPFGLVIGGAWRNLDVFGSFGFQGRKEHIGGISAETKIIAHVATRSKIGGVFPLLGELLVLETQGSAQRLLFFII